MMDATGLVRHRIAIDAAGEATLRRQFEAPGVKGDPAPNQRSILRPGSASPACSLGQARVKRAGV
jgi:hypothetical protein